MEEHSDRLINSDVKMVASKTFEDILNTVKNSNLNFHLQLSPFSAIISLKKSLVCDKSGSPLLPNLNVQVPDDKPLIIRNQQLEAELVRLETVYGNLAHQFNGACTMIKSLEDAIQNSDTEAAQKVSEFKAVIEELKGVILQHENNERTHGTEIEDLKRRIKKSDEVAIRLNKEVNDIRIRNQEEKAAIKKDHKLHVKWLKKDIGKLKSENLKLLKAKDTNKEGDKLRNPAKFDIPDDTAEVSDFDPSTVICNICGVVIPDYQPKFFLGDEINPACAKCDDPISSDSESVADCNVLDRKIDDSSENIQNVCKLNVDGECKHSPQCVLRQPFPPPLPSVTYLKNDRSKYHLHMMSSGEVPGCYGGHDRCLNAYSKNYGCEACIWLKWFGQLHGFPDINPGDYKKYLDTK